MRPENQLGARRAEIDTLDNDLLRLLNRRAELASEVLALKRVAGLPVCDPRRELEVLARVRENNPGPLENRAVETVFRQVIYETRRAEERAAAPSSKPETHALRPSPPVAFQGERGAFSEAAIEQLFPKGTERLPCRDFDSLFDTLAKGASGCAVVPLENTIAGPVNRCYDLLYDSDLHIVGETVVHVSHCLIGCPDATLADIKTVESHPVALAQCQRFLAANPQIHPIASDDTAGSVKTIMQRGDKSCAAVARAGAALTYGARILAQRLEDHAENFTRFILVSQAQMNDTGADKSSLVISLSKRTGVLRQALAAFADRGIDLVAVHPRPVVGRPWEYRFFMDFAASADSPQMGDAMAELSSSATVQELRVLGSYRAADDLQTHNEYQQKELAKQ